MNDKNTFEEKDLNNEETKVLFEDEKPEFESIEFVEEPKENSNRPNNDGKKSYNDYPDFFFAGFFIRFFAFLVDSIIIGAFSRILVDGSLSLIFKDFYVSSMAINLLRLLVLVLYFTILTYATNGQTIGKMLFGIRVVSFREPRLKLGTVITREFFGRIIHSYGILQALYVICAFSPRKQHLGDILADTSVVTEKVIEASKLDLSTENY